MSRETLDKLMSKWISRKLLVFLLATIFLCFKLITNSDWLVISSIYIGTETAITVISNYTNKV